MSAETQTEERIINRHEVILGLILKILPDIFRSEVRHFIISINRSSDEILTIWRELSTFHMAFLIKFNMPPQLCGKLFFFHIFDSCLVSKHIYGHTRRNQPLVPLQHLSQQCHETRWRHHTDFSSQYLGSYCSLFLLVTFI